MPTDLVACPSALGVSGEQPFAPPGPAEEPPAIAETAAEAAEMTAGLP